MLHGDGAERGRVDRGHSWVVLEVELLRGGWGGGCGRAQALVGLHRVGEVHVQGLELALVLAELILWRGKLCGRLFDGGEAVAHVIHLHILEPVYILHGGQVGAAKAIGAHTLSVRGN